MTDWKYNLYLADLKDEFDRDDDEVDVERCVNVVKERLKLLKQIILKEDDDPEYFIGGLSGLDYHIDEFEYFDYTGSQQDNISLFNHKFNELYDWADWSLIWINVNNKNMNGIGKL